MTKVKLLSFLLLIKVSRKKQNKTTNPNITLNKDVFRVIRKRGMILSQEILKPNPENAAPAKLNLFPSSMFPDDLSYFANFPQDKADL